VRGIRSSFIRTKTRRKMMGWDADGDDWSGMTGGGWVDWSTEWMGSEGVSGDEVLACDLVSLGSDSRTITSLVGACGQARRLEVVSKTYLIGIGTLALGAIGSAISKA
jgi:hypothetical protein